MIKAELLIDDASLKTIAKGSGVHNRMSRLMVGEVNGVPSLVFDTAENEYGSSYVHLEDLKKIIDSILEKHPKRNKKIIGYTTRPLSLPGLPIIIQNSPVYSYNNKYFIQLQHRDVVIPTEADFIRYI